MGVHFVRTHSSRPPRSGNNLGRRSLPMLSAALPFFTSLSDRNCAAAFARHRPLSSGFLRVCKPVIVSLGSCHSACLNIDARKRERARCPNYSVTRKISNSRLILIFDIRPHYFQMHLKTLLPLSPCTLLTKEM